ncbi:hypothetical protein [Natronococcus sp. A-GB7]|uniref:hypothetical protein n=1 Tax=Natronococcus sp. A-GB7 TaxID=3037649 RepID=UPI00241C5D87|nr:hypothetical protein [Natronococcus sp. A-GB7]MDG5819745.1 hypothetical protein [Natronococcus sp. A-GB7]
MTTQRHDDATETTPTIETAEKGASSHAGDLAARIAVLEAENSALRTEYARVHRSKYRRTALSLSGIGVLALLAGLVLPAERAVFLVLGGIGIFAGVSIYYLTPERVVSAAVGERVYAALASNMAAIGADLGLHADAVYVPVPEDRPRSARLFVPLLREYRLPSPDSGPIVVDGDERGLLLEPTGMSLYREFDRMRTTPVAETPGGVASQLCDGLVEVFELATSAAADVDATDGRITVAITGAAFGDVDRFDNPVASFLAVGIAVGLGEPVSVDAVPGDDRATWLVTCRYSLE